MIVRSLLVVGVLTFSFGLASNAQDAGSMIELGPIEVPDGETEELLSFLGEIDALRGDLTKEYQAAISKITAAQTKASTELLNDADALSDEQFSAAAQYGLANRIRTLRSDDVADDLDEQMNVLNLVKRQFDIASKKGLSRNDLNNGFLVAGYLERYGDTSLALDAYESFAATFKKSKDANLRRYADRFESSARKLALLGNPIELTGELVDGSEFDWESYRGKVVLVDFWATWCGPCLAEAPNVRQNYDQYQDRGFDVIGISLDDNRKRLEDYIAKNDVPWKNLFQDGAGWKHPMAKKYGINAIPSVFLVDQEGNVVSLRARGSALGEQLSELLDNDEAWARAVESLSESIASDGEDASLFARRAAAYLATKRWDLALKDHQRAAALDPELSATIAKTYRELGRDKEADEFEPAEAEDTDTDKESE